MSSWLTLSQSEEAESDFLEVTAGVEICPADGGTMNDREWPGKCLCSENQELEANKVLGICK